MAEILYRIMKRTVSLHGEKTTVYTPVIARTGKVETKSLGKKIAAESTISDNEAKRFVDGFVMIVKEMLLDGFQVKLSKLGTFSPAIKSKALKKSDDVDSDCILKTSIHFRPSDTMNKEIRNAVFKKLDLDRIKKV